MSTTGGNTMFSLPCNGICEIPQINGEPRNVFMKRCRSALPIEVAPPPAKRYISQGDDYMRINIDLFHLL